MGRSTKSARQVGLRGWLGGGVLGVCAVVAAFVALRGRATHESDVRPPEELVDVASSTVRVSEIAPPVSGPTTSAQAASPHDLSIPAPTLSGSTSAQAPRARRGGAPPPRTAASAQRCRGSARLGAPLRPGP